MSNFIAILSILCGLLSFCSSIYAGFSHGGFGSAILTALVAAPACYISIFLTKFVTNTVLLELLRQADLIDNLLDQFLTKSIVIMTVPAHLLITAIVPYGVYIGANATPGYKEQILIWVFIGIILCPLCYAIACVMTYLAAKISSYMAHLIRG